MNPDQKKRANKEFIWLMVVFILPVIVAVILFNVNGLRPTGTTNNGELIMPARPLKNIVLQQLDGSVFTIDQLQGKWTLVYISDSGCGDLCKHSIYKMRQLRWAQGDNMTRIQRLLLLADNEHVDTLEPVLKKYTGMLTVTGDSKVVAEVVSQFELKNKAPALDANRLYLVDPLGNLMMSYPVDAEPKGIIKDMKKLLKISQIG